MNTGIKRKVFKKLFASCLQKVVGILGDCFVFLYFFVYYNTVVKVNGIGASYHPHTLRVWVFFHIMSFLCTLPLTCKKTFSKFIINFLIIQFETNMPLWWTTSLNASWSCHDTMIIYYFKLTHVSMQYTTWKISTCSKVSEFK